MSKLFKSKFLFALVLALAVFVVGSTVADAAITKTLRQGMRDAQVMELQQFLNANGFTVSTTGAGSTGAETTYFGSKTKTAVMAFQTAKGLTADGVFGPMSRAAMAGTTTTTTFPAGCSSASGFSTTTGLPCNGGTTTTLPAGCMAGYAFSSTTGLPCVGGTTTTQTGPVQAMIAPTNPASTTVVAGQATARIADFAFTGAGSVTGVTLKRIGVSADSTLSNVYLFDGAMRLTDAASVSSNGSITFNIPAGIFMVNGSKTISVRTDIAAGTSGQTVGVELVSFTTASGTTTANLMGNIHTVANPGTLASVSAGTITPSGATLNPGANVTVWQSTLNISTRDVMMKRIAFRNIGSAPATAFGGFKLFVNGVQVGTAVGLDANGYVTFDLMSNPVTLQSGSRIVRLDADIVSGASRTVQFSLRNAADVDFVDSNFGVNIIPTSAPWTATASTISGGTGGSMTVEKDTTSPSTTVVLNGNDVTLGTFKLTAYGEAIKVETLTAGFTYVDTVDDNPAGAGSTATLRNGRILFSTDGTNWTQYGSTATLLPAGTSFTTNFTVNPGTPAWVKVNADIFDNDGTGNISATDTLVATLITGSSNAQKLDSLGSVNVPTASVSANTLAVATTAVAVAVNSTYVNQSSDLPATNFKIGAWNVTGSSVEDVLLTTLSFDADEQTGATLDFDDLTNLYAVVKDGSGTVSATTTPLATVGAADNNFPINYTLVKNAGVVVELYANIASGATATHSFRTDLSVSGTSMVGGTAVSVSDVNGQTIAYAVASITVTKDATSPVTGIVYDNQTVTSVALKFASLTSAYDVTDLTFTIAGTGNTVVQSVQLYDGATLVATRPGAATVTFNGLTWNIPANTNKVLTVKLVLGNIGVSAGTSGSALTTTLTAFTAVNKSTGVSGAGTITSGAGSAMYAYASTPTITLAALPSTTLNAGTQTLAKFTVASNGGTIAWNRFIFSITKSSAPILASFTLWDGSNQVAGAATIIDTANAATCAAGVTGCRVQFIPTAEEQISGSKTYELKATVSGVLAADLYVSTAINAPSTFAAPTDYPTAAAVGGTFATYAESGAMGSFIWSDVSAASHATTVTTDWSKDFLIKNLPTDSQTLTY